MRYFDGKVRNHGRWADWAKETFAKYDDKQSAYLKHVMSNYSIVEEYVYRRSDGTEESHSRQMKTILFKLIDPNSSIK